MISNLLVNPKFLCINIGLHEFAKIAYNYNHSSKLSETYILICYYTASKMMFLKHILNIKFQVLFLIYSKIKHYSQINFQRIVFK